MNCRRNAEHTKFRSMAAMAALLFAVSACSESGENDGEGGTSPFPSSGAGPNAQCAEVVDSVAIVDGEALTPSLTPVNGGFAVALISGGEAWLVVIDEAAKVQGSAQLSSSGGQARLPSVHPNGSGMLALWAEGSNVMMRPLSATGAPSGPPQLVSTTTSEEPRPVGAGVGNAVGAAWMEAGTSVAGILAGSSLQQPNTVAGWFPAVSASGSDVFVAWSGGGRQGPVNVAPLSGMAKPVVVPGSSSLIKSLAIAGGAAFVAWEEVGAAPEQIGLAKVDFSQGVVATGNPSAPGSSANWPAVAASGDVLALAYYQFRGGAPSVFLTLLDSDLGAIGNELEIAGDARYPSVAWGESGVAVAYNINGGPVEVSVISCP